METPQRSIINPLISNILLRKLDCFMAEYVNKYSNFVSSDKKTSEEYNKTMRYMGSDWKTVWATIRELTHKDLSGAQIQAALRTIRKLDAAAKGIRYH